MTGASLRFEGVVERSAFVPAVVNRTANEAVAPGTIRRERSLPTISKSRGRDEAFRTENTTGPVGTERRETVILVPVSWTPTGTAAPLSAPEAAAPPTATTPTMAAIAATTNAAPGTETLWRRDVNAFRT
jgi:hypothetical protein